MTLIHDFIFEDDSDEARELARTVEKFASETISLASGALPEFRRSDFEKMARLGLCGASLPESAGGSSLTHLQIAAIIFALARHQLGPAIYLSVHLMVSRLISSWSGVVDRAALLKSLADGSTLGAFCLTESQAGSDASAIRTRAVRVENGWKLNGEKIYITSGSVADCYLVFARTGDDPKKGISAFVLPKKTPGLTTSTPEKKLGCEGAPIASVTFADCLLPSEGLLGAEGDGYKIALSGLTGGRINIAAAACGLSSRAIEIASSHAKSRKQFGSPISEFQGIQFMLADMTAAHRASVLLTRDACREADRARKASAEAAIAKCFASDSAMKTTTDAVQILGGAGYLQEYEVERLMRDAKMLQIVEGTNQIQRLLIARHVLGDAG
jgi:alkylation response protein AidB-like acyl-CoA dehydrogenase